MKGLMLHCGGHEVDWDTLTNNPTPEATRTYVPIPHHDFVNRVRDVVVKHNYNITNETHGLAKGGDRYIGIMQLESGDGNKEYDTLLGLRNGHDKMVKSSIGIGAGVFVCDNMSFSAEITVARKHTRHIMQDIPQLVESAVGQVAAARRIQDTRFDTYKTTKLTDNLAHDLTIQALDVGAILPSYIPKVIEEWREPSHEEFTEDGHTMWRFFNACTQAYKVMEPANLAPRTMALHNLLDTCAGLAV